MRETDRLQSGDLEREERSEGELEGQNVGGDFIEIGVELTVRDPKGDAKLC